MKKTLLLVIITMLVIALTSCTDTNKQNSINNIQAETLSGIQNDYTKTFSGNKCGEKAYWDFNNNTLTISGSGDIYDFYVELDPNSEKTSWISDMPWFDLRSDITNVFISEGITRIGVNCFRGCISLKTVTLPDTLQSIGRIAFMGCWSIDTIDIPDSVTSIEDEAFRGSYVKQITFGSGISECGKCICLDCEQLEQVTFKDGIKVIGEEAFKGCRGINEVTLPDSLEIIGETAFSQCGIKKIVFGNGLKIISDNLFDGCKTDTLDIPEGETSIGIGAFYGNNTVTSITFPSTLTSIKKYAFTQCDSLTDIYFIGTEEQWRSIQMEKGNEILHKANVHYQ